MDFLGKGRVLWFQSHFREFTLFNTIRIRLLDQVYHFSLLICCPYSSHEVTALGLRPVRLNGWVFIYKLSGCGFESRCSHLKFRYRTCLEQGCHQHSVNFRVWIHSKLRTWHDKNIQSNALYRQVLSPQLNHLGQFCKWLIVRSQTKWLWVRVPLESLIKSFLVFFLFQTWA